MTGIRATDNSDEAEAPRLPDRDKPVTLTGRQAGALRRWLQTARSHAARKEMAESIRAITLGEAILAEAISSATLPTLGSGD